MGLGGFLGLGEVRDLYRKVGDIGGLHFHQVPSKSVPRGAKTSQKTVYLRIPSEQTTCCFLQARTEPRLGMGVVLGVLGVVLVFLEVVLEELLVQKRIPKRGFGRSFQ